MILFHLQRLGAQRSELCFFNLKKIKFRKKNIIFSQNFSLLSDYLWFCVIFLWKQMENNFLKFTVLLAIKLPSK